MQGIEDGGGRLGRGFGKEFRERVWEALGLA